MTGLRLPVDKTIDFNELLNVLMNERNIPLNQRPRHKLRVPIPLLIPHPDLPQRRHSEEYLNQLANNIKDTGILYPPICVLDAEQKKFLIVCGNARRTSAHLAGLSKIEIAVVWLTMSETFKFSISENLERSEFHPLEEAEHYSKWVEKAEMTVSAIAREMHRSQGHVSNRIRLLTLPGRIKELLWQNKIGVYAALEILKVKDPRVQVQLAELKAEGITNQELKQKISQAVLGQTVVQVEVTSPTPAPAPSLTLPRRPSNRELLRQIEPAEPEEQLALSELNLAMERLGDLQSLCERSVCDACPSRDECLQWVKLAKRGGREVPEHYQKLIKWLRQQILTRQRSSEYARNKLRELGLEQ